MAKSDLDAFLRLPRTKTARPFLDAATKRRIAKHLASIDAAQVTLDTVRRRLAYADHLATRPGGNEWPADPAWREWADRFATLVTVKRAAGHEKWHAVGYAESQTGYFDKPKPARSDEFARGVECRETAQRDVAAYRLGVAYREWARGGVRHV